jgi:TPR repeat protein
MAAAARHYRAAAEAGNADGQRNLGVLYARGHGVARDPVEAYAWLGLAALQGNAWAERRRDEIAGGMGAEQRARALRRLEDLRGRIGP